MVLTRHAERGQDDDKHEEVVNTECFLGDVAAEVLLAVFRPPQGPDNTTKDQGNGDVGERPPGRFLQSGFVGSTDVADDVDNDHGEDDGRQNDPGERVHVHTGASGTSRVPEVSSRQKDLASDAGGHAAWAGRRDDDATVGGSTPLRLHLYPSRTQPLSGDS